MWVEAWELAEDAGMLFVFEQPAYRTFWMKNTLIPLDMLWIDEGGTIVHVEEYANPCGEEGSKNDDCPLYGPDEWVLAKYVLEVNANQTRLAGMVEWVKVDIYGVD